MRIIFDWEISMTALLHRQTDKNKLSIFYLTRYRRGIIKNFNYENFKKLCAVGWKPWSGC